MKQIIIKGDFTLEGDIPALSLVENNFEYAQIDIEERSSIRMRQFKSITKKKMTIKEQCNLILKKKVKDRTETEHHYLIKNKYNENVRDYLLSMGPFKD